MQKHNYKWEATTLEGFIQQLAVAYVARGYFFYVSGRVPTRLSVADHDRRLLVKFDVAKSKWSRYRRRRRTGVSGHPLANVQYLRHGNFWVLLATHGEHVFFAEHARADGAQGDIKRQYRDAREAPIVYGGYSISWNNRTSVRMSPRAYKELKTHFLYMATREHRDVLEREFRKAPFEPYAGVARQMFAILRAVNRARKTAGLPTVPRECIRVRRHVVRPFAELPNHSNSVVINEQFPLAA